MGRATADRSSPRGGAAGTWQVWHVRAEAQRRVRAADLATGRGSSAVVDWSSTRSWTAGRCASPTPTTSSPSRRSCAGRTGASVYTVAGADLYTSAAVLAAEQRLVEAAGRHDGHACRRGRAWSWRCCEQAANGVTLNAGQAALVRAMATSGARLQLAIAPAGAGKTTAMRALASAWTDDGGTVIGLAPSAAAAAAVLARPAPAPATDTLAKLTWSISTTATLPDWAAGIGPATLVVIDEAGMADTLVPGHRRRVRHRPGRLASG